MANNNEDAETPDVLGASGSGDPRLGYIDVARLLAEMSRGGRYRQFKDRHGQAYTTFEHYVEDSLGWKDRKARYFVTIYERLVVEAGIEEEALAGLEWSKASQLARLPKAVLANPKMVDKWITRAKTLGHRALEVEVNRTKNADAEKRGVASNLRAEVLFRETFRLDFAQHRNVRRALASARALTGSEKKSDGLDCIALGFLAGREFEGAAGIDQILRAVERVFQVKIVSVTDGEKRAKKRGDE